MSKFIKLEVLKGHVLGVNVYRGYAKLCDLSTISCADIFDQKKNPFGTQRDLSPKHAKDAYNYILNTDIAFWPEVFLCIRDKSVVTFKEKSQNSNIGYITIKLIRFKKRSKILISRVDGNHRLHYASGGFDGFPAIKKEVSFCMAFGLSLEQEIKLFRDINDNQKRMNTSHLDNIAVRLTEKEILKTQKPTLYIAKTLGEDKDSPIYEKVYAGGKSLGYFTIPLRSLKAGLVGMFSHSRKLSALNDVDAQYKVIKNYFTALKEWEPDAWAKPKEYLLLRGSGLWAACYIGSDVIDRCLSSGKFDHKAMLKILKSGSKWDWSRSGSFSGFGGQGGAIKIKDKVVGDFADESGISIKSLAKEILND